MPGLIPPIIKGIEIHLMDLYKLVESLGGYLSIYFAKEFGCIAEMFGLLHDSGEEIRKCYNKYLDVFKCYYSTAKVPNQDQRSNLDIPARSLEVGKGYTCPTTHQWDFGEHNAPNLEVASKKGKEKLEHFGVKLEEENEYHDRKLFLPMQPNKRSIQYNDIKIKEEETSSTSSGALSNIYMDYKRHTLLTQKPTHSNPNQSHATTTEKPEHRHPTPSIHRKDSPNETPTSAKTSQPRLNSATSPEYAPVLLVLLKNLLLSFGCENLFLNYIVFVFCKRHACNILDPGHDGGDASKVERWVMVAVVEVSGSGGGFV
nr:ARID DNA-binding domain-containing protein [Tanacetum cinerariifolium]